MNSAQSRLSRKTKAAAWWLIVVGALAAIMGIALILLNPAEGYNESEISAPDAYTIFILSMSLPGVLNIIAGIMLLKRRPKVRRVAMTLLSIESIFFLVAAIGVAIFENPSLAFPFVIALALYLTPLVLLLLDRRKTKTD